MLIYTYLLPRLQNTGQFRVLTYQLLSHWWKGSNDHCSEIKERITGSGLVW